MKKLKLFVLALMAIALFNCQNDREEAVKPDETASAEVPQGMNLTTSGSFSMLSYNVAGLPDILSSGNPAENTHDIGRLVRTYDVVHVQEDFNYHATLYANDNHAYRTATSGGVPFGDGLNTMSKYEFTDFQRVKWNNCNGTDCLTPKGFTFMRIRLAEGVYVDYYNAHPNAGSADADLSARRANITQLSQFINANSGGNAVIVAGDMNCRYTRSGDNIRELLTNNGLTDVWIQLIRNGNIPAIGSPALDCDVSNINNSCEEVDKIFYRSSKQITLTPSNFQIDNAAFYDANGNPLSDHFPTSVNFSWQMVNTFRTSDLFGGPHGTLFNDMTALSASSKVKKAILRGGARIDQVKMELTNGTILTHGGTGGTEKSLTLNTGEYINYIKMCSGQKDGRTRVFYIELKTNQNRVLSVGTQTSSVFTYTAPSGYQVVGYQGRSGSEVDKLGVICVPVN
jgi:endonuclease/exonuclease/phosphatase family metal-dependent hydrolase